MGLSLKILLLTLLMNLSSAHADVSVTTYNMGQLSSWGFDFVACTSQRVDPQMHAIFKDPNSPIKRSDKFVLFIQEAWTWKVFRHLERFSDKHGYKMYPKNFNLLKNNGQVTITNMKPLQVTFHPYSIDKQSNKGMLYMKLDLGNGKTLGALNVHTGYSDAYKASDLHLEHFKEVHASLQKHRSKTDYFVLGGDFNAGPDMEYRNQRYDSAKTIWFNGLMPYMKSNKMKLIEGINKKTWDGNNSLVNDPPFIIQLSHFFWNLTFTWDQIDSTIDHIFVSEEVNVKSSSVVFDQPVKLFCYGREDKDGKLHLSDHYGAHAVLDI